MHFTSTQLTDENLVYQKWHVLPLKEDFMTLIRKLGVFPISSFKKKLEIAEQNRELKHRVTGLNGANQSELGVKYDHLEGKYSK